MRFNCKVHGEIPIQKSNQSFRSILERDLGATVGSSKKK